MLLSEAINFYLTRVADKRHKASALPVVASNLRQWERALGHYDIADITPQDVIRVRDTYDKPATRNRQMSMLSSVYEALTERGLYPVGQNPTRRVRREPPRNENTGKFISDVAVQKILSQAETIDPHLHTIAATVLATACRPGEIADLEPKHVNVDSGPRTATLRFVDTKNGDDRTVPIPDHVAELYRTRGLPGKMKRSSWNKVVAASGVQCRFYDLKHTAVTRMIEAGHSTALVQKMAGHRTPMMTIRYAHPQVETLRQLQE